MFKTIAGLQVFVPTIEQRMPHSSEAERFAVFDAQHDQLLGLLEKAKLENKHYYDQSGPGGYEPLLRGFPSLREQDFFENYAVLDFREPEGGLHRAATFGLMLALDVQRHPLHALFLTHTLRFVNRGGLKSEILPAHPLPSAKPKKEAA